MTHARTQPVATGISRRKNLAIAVVVPSYRVTDTILDVVTGLGPEVQRVYVVDDGCPDGSGALVQQRAASARVKVVYHGINRGVGAATLTGYRHALNEGADVIVKLDGDGQMDATLLPRLLAPLLRGEADYTKGNRFYNLADLRSMPPLRIVGNAVLSLLAKVSTGYWDIADPTNGYTCIHARVARSLCFRKISRRYFFESDMLFHLNTLRAAIVDVPMPSRYGDEVSHLNILRIIPEFLLGHTGNLVRRLFYTYVLRDFGVATLQFGVGVSLNTDYLAANTLETGRFFA